MTRIAGIDPKAGLDFWMLFTDVLAELGPNAELESVEVDVTNAIRGEYGVDGDAAFCWISEAINGSTVEIDFVGVISDGAKTWRVPSSISIPAAKVRGERVIS